jgi:cytochrome c peroxidase
MRNCVRKKTILLILLSTFLFASGDWIRAEELAGLKAEYSRPPVWPARDPKLVELGRELFFDPKLSSSGKTACASCHFPQLGWGVTDARSRNDAGKLTSRKPQPLLGVGHIAGPVGWDGRNASLEAQATSSIATGSMSLHGTQNAVVVEVIEGRIRSDERYKEKFGAALPNRPISLETIAIAIAEFERSLDPGVAPFDRWISGDEQAVSESAKRGFALFTGKANCFACHSGWRFTDDLFHDIGTSTSDRGRGNVLKDDEQTQFAFKTPTLRSVTLRPPYMHDAAYQTLEDVMVLYEKGGIDRPSRSPMMVAIELTLQERHDLVAFLQSLTGDESVTALPRDVDQVRV